MLCNWRSISAEIYVSDVSLVCVMCGMSSSTNSGTTKSSVCPVRQCCLAAYHAGKKNYILILRMSGLCIVIGIINSASICVCNVCVCVCVCCVVSVNVCGMCLVSVMFSGDDVTENTM